MEAKHTATPWRADQAACGYIYAICNSENHVIRVETNKPENTEFIVRACNAHDDLVKALQLFLKYDETDHEDGVAMMLLYAEALDTARAAIAKACAA